MNDNINLSTLTGTFVDYIRGLHEGKSYFLTVVCEGDNFDQIANTKSRLFQEIKTCHKFGFADGLGLFLQQSLPSQFTSMVPYVATLIALFIYSIRKKKKEALI